MATEYCELNAVEAERCRPLTFPAYRHLLDLRPGVRHPDRGDRRAIQPLGFAAVEGGKPQGLVLGCVPFGSPDPSLELANDPELLSVYVAPAARRQGIAGALLQRLEEAVAAAGFRRLSTVYMTGPSEIESLERILQRRQWSPPQPRMLILKGTLQEIVAAPWYGKYQRRDHFEFFPWSELSAEDLERLRTSHQETGWIAKDLVPWHYDTATLEPGSSIGIRLAGEVVGWVINHRLGDDTVRFTCSFIRRDLARRARILPAYSESIRRAHEADLRRLMFSVPMHHPAMVGFALRWCAPWLSFQGETRGSAKELASHGPSI